MERVIEWDKLPVSLVPKDLTRVLPIGVQAAYSLCHQGEIPVLRVGRKFIISRDALKSWLENNHAI